MYFFMLTLSRNHLQVCCPLHLLGGLHPKADMGDAVAQAALAVLLLHHGSPNLHSMYIECMKRFSKKLRKSGQVYCVHEKTDFEL